MLSKFFDETLAVAEQILLHPVFPEEELRTYCAKRKQRLAVERTKVDTQAREAFARAFSGPRIPTASRPTKPNTINSRAGM